MELLLQNGEYVALDIETTGLQPKTDKILEIGAVRIKNGEILETYSEFVKSTEHIPGFITELTGITDEMLAEGIPEEQAIRELVAFCKELPILGHNVLFDYRFLKRSAVNHDLAFEVNGIDTLEIARKFLQQEQKKNLQTLCAYYQISREHCHRAYDDAVAAAELYECMKKEFYEVEPKAFLPKPLVCKIKKESPITNSQKGYLNDLIKYHRIGMNVSVEHLTKNEASRLIDGIILKYGRIKR